MVRQAHHPELSRRTPQMVRHMVLRKSRKGRLRAEPIGRARSATSGISQREGAKGLASGMSNKSATWRPPLTGVAANDPTAIRRGNRHFAACISSPSPGARVRTPSVTGAVAETSDLRCQGAARDFSGHRLGLRASGRPLCSRDNPGCRRARSRRVEERP